MLESLKEKVDVFKEKMVKYQTKFFLNLFYFVVVPFAYLYLKGAEKLHHEKTGFFQEAEHKSNDIERHKKQY